MKKQFGVLAAAGATLALLLCSPAWADLDFNMPVGVTTTSHEVYALHMKVFWVCLGIAVLVYGLMVYAIVNFKKANGAKAAQFTHSTRFEILWTIIPAVILVLLAIPSVKTLVTIEDTRDADLTVKVTGFQWRWRYDYMGKNVGFYSALDRKSNAARQPNSGIDPYSVEHYLREVDHPLVVPVDAKVRLLITAADVLHAWWVPDLAVKRDAIPGFVNESWFKATEEGTYRGQCAELCGMDHGFMPIVVQVVSQDEFKDWLAKQAAPNLTRAD
jgi:cytochrome c oxidase subunit 2